MALQAKDVAKPTGGDKCRGESFSFEYGIGGHCRAMCQFFDAVNRNPTVDQRVECTFVGLLRYRRYLGDRNSTITNSNEIRESSAHLNTQSHLSPLIVLLTVIQYRVRSILKPVAASLLYYERLYTGEPPHVTNQSA